MSDAPPPVGHLLETALYVEDLDRAEAFYATRLGLAPIFRDARMCALAVPGRMTLLLFRRGACVAPAHTPGGMIPPHDAAGAQHLCFAIEADALPAWRTHLAAQGIAVESEVVWKRGGTSLYFRDPDGHSVEIATPGLWPDW